MYNAGKPLWWTGTAGNSGAKVALQSDGNLVVYAASGRALWASGQADNSYAYTWEESDRGSAELRSGWMLHSPNGRYKLVMQEDGNLVLYSPRRAVWSSGTSGNPGAHFAFQSDGNMVVYSSTGAVKWTSRTSRGDRFGFYYLFVQNDGNTVGAYQTGTDASSPVRVFWQTRTGGVS